MQAEGAFPVGQDQSKPMAARPMPGTFVALARHLTSATTFPKSDFSVSGVTATYRATYLNIEKVYWHCSGLIV